MRAAQEVMAELAATGMSAEQIALVIELSAAVASEARPIADKAAENKRAYDREYQRERRKSRTISYDNNDIVNKGSPEVSPENPLPNPSKSIPLNPPKKRAPFPAPEGVSDEQWEAFCKQRKKALNARAYTLLTNKLAELVEAGHDPGEMIDLATERGWETVFPPRDFDKGKSAYVSASGYEYRGDPESVMREARRRGDNDTYWRVSSDLNRGRAHA